MIKVSATGLKSFLECPYKWHYRRTLPQKDVSTTPALIKGGVVHDAIEELEKGYYSLEDVQPIMINSLYEKLSEPNVVFTKWDSVSKIAKSCNEMLGNYILNRQGTVVTSELSFAHLLKTHRNTEFAIIGRIDQIVDTNKGMAVVDLKTSRLPPTRYEIAGDYQFTLYALAYKLQYGRLPDKVYNFHLGSGKYIEYPRDNSSIKQLRHKLDDVVHTLEDIKDCWEEYHKTRGWHCNRCAYRDACYPVED